MVVKISRAFKDISLSFTKHPVTNDVTVLKNEDAIKKSVVNLCRTRINERFFNELLGTSIEDSLFETNLDDISSFIEREITVLLKNYEPRITLTNVIAESLVDSYELQIRVEYEITGLPFPTQNIEFLLQPTRI
jgi:phage baseplate assembly protein W|tara:strand:+ start:282 stop:683 length:402 start_codon:yes stop_codon:yes gene_type:complete